MPNRNVRVVRLGRGQLRLDIPSDRNGGAFAWEAVRQVLKLHPTGLPSRGVGRQPYWVVQTTEGWTVFVYPILSVS